MAQVTQAKDSTTVITVEDVNRVLDVGRLLLTVLTEDELAALSQMLDADRSVIALEKH